MKQEHPRWLAMTALPGVVSHRPAGDAPSPSAQHASGIGWHWHVKNVAKRRGRQGSVLAA